MKTIHDDLKTYPTPLKRRSGMKVSWAYYATEAEARTCAEAARFNGHLLEARGYDFGFQSPGSLTPPGMQNWHPELWEVCLP